MMNFNFTAHDRFYRTETSDRPTEEDSTRRAYENLSRLAARYTFIIGTCSLLHPKFPEMMSRLAPMLRDNQKALIVPGSVIGDLQRLAVKNPDMTDQVNSIIQLLAGLRMEGLVQVCGTGTEMNSRSQILRLAEQMLEYTEPLIITQNNRLSEELVAINRVRPTMTSRLAVSRVNHYGFLSRYIPQGTMIPQAPGLDAATLSALTADMQLGA